MNTASSAPHFTTAPPSRQRLLKRSEVAQRLGLSVSSLEKWAELGTGPRYYRRGLSPHAPTRYRIEDVEEFVCQRYGQEGLATIETFVQLRNRDAVANLKAAISLIPNAD